MVAIASDREIDRDETMPNSESVSQMASSGIKDKSVLHLNNPLITLSYSWASAQPNW